LIDGPERRGLEVIQLSRARRPHESEDRCCRSQKSDRQHHKQYTHRTSTLAGTGWVAGKNGAGADRAACAPGPRSPFRANERLRYAFVTTEIELSGISTAAPSGPKIPTAAKPTLTTL